jgi:hypothetical protein
VPPSARRGPTVAVNDRRWKESVLSPVLCSKAQTLASGLAEKEKDMRRVKRKSRILRRLVLGLAVAAIVAPAAQARPDEGTATQGKAKDPGVVIRGDDKKIVTLDDGSGALINGDDKEIVPWAGDSTVLIHGDDKVFAPPSGYYSLADYYRRAYPQDHGDPTAVLAGNDKAIVPAPSTFDWGDALVGAGAAFGLMLLLGGAALATRHVRPTAA